MQKSKIKNILTYGLNKKSNFKIKNILFQKNKSFFDVEIEFAKYKKIYFKKI